MTPRIRISPEEANSEPIQALIRLLEQSAYKTWDSVLVGNQCESVRKTYEDMKNPQVGDLVIEWSTIFSAKMKLGGKLEHRGICGIGYLLRIAREPFFTPESWAEQGGGDEPIPTEKVIYIELFDGREMRWTNADILKVSLERHP